MPIGTRRSARLKVGDSTTEEKISKVPNIENRQRKRGQGIKRGSTSDDNALSQQKESGAKDQPQSGAGQPSCNSPESSRTADRESCDTRLGDGENTDCIGTLVVETKGETGGESISSKSLEEILRNVQEAYKQESLGQKHIKGKPKSGRTWKTEQTARFSDMRKDRPLRSSWQLKMAQKAEKLSVRKFQKELHDAKIQAIELKKQRRAEHQKKKEENQKKSEVVQVIRNTAKLKRMRKKQLRLIEKR